jgi:type I restriction-modification system DNA methylase subunit
MNALDILCRELDFESGSLLAADDAPFACTPDDWLEKGEWLAAAKRAGVEKLFFVDNNPVAVFAECKAGVAEKVKAFNKAWCLARPRLLFLASEGEITVYDLAQRPVNENDSEDWKKLKNLAILENLREAATKLEEFHRDNLESGRLFGDARFGDLKNRADQALIRDLKTVRRELIDAGLSGEKVRYAHALIGRSIFIRYLEDRKILRRSYFEKVARQRKEWGELLNFAVPGIGVDLSKKEGFYLRVLTSKDFTYALFKQLASDFNGDMFPEDAAEELTVTQDHLTLIQNLLYGETGVTRKLFFYSYQFDIIPLDLISSIYEEFYHSNVAQDEKKSKARQDGAFYTPPVLAEFVLSRVLTSEILAKKPRVLDPACGSGIFLVEAFRRIVRHTWRETGILPTFDDLKTILRDQIAGIEVNPEAARVAAFSLYLAQLHYLDPPDILQQIEMGNRLPNLVASDQDTPNHFHCILPENAFDTARIETNPLWRQRFGPGCADVAVGNPPWGDPGKKADEITRVRQAKLLEWCEKNEKPIGDNEPSQAFLWLAHDLVKNNGEIGLLISSGALFKINNTSKKFREQCFKAISLKEVFNFAHVRKYFFKGAISPFILVICSKTQEPHPVTSYWSAKESTSLNVTQAVLFSKYDQVLFRQLDVSNYKNWKILWWGSEKDLEFIGRLSEYENLSNYADRSCCGRGFETNGNKDATALKDYKCLPHEQFARYDSLVFKNFQEPPKKIYRLGNIKLYSGKRILVQRGVRERYIDKGQIISRFESRKFCFSELLYGIRLKEHNDFQYKLILGILWSSLARYYFFMTSGTWMPWHPKIHLNDILGLPVKYIETGNYIERLVSVVDKLRNNHPQERDVFHQDGVPEEEIEAQRRQWERELDEVVFDLYELNDEQRDLIRDCCEVTLPFFYKPFDSVGAMPAVEERDLSWIENYAQIFGRRWNAYLDEGQEMRAEVHLGAHGNMLAMEFYPADKDDLWDLKPKDDSWRHILEQIGEKLPQSMGTSRILLDGVAYVISDDGIIIIKRNEKRFWTRTLAREDADSTLCKRMTDTMPDARRLG